MFNISFNFDLFNNYYYFYERLVVLTFSLIPTLILVGFVLYSDRKNKEPVRNIVICLLSGILSVALSGYLEQLVMPYIGNNTILTYIFAFIEEISKMAIFFLFVFDNKYYDDMYDGLVYMMLIALSFAGLENVMYAFSESTIQESISLSIMRDITTIPLHVICGIIIGYFLSLSSFSKNKERKYINILLALLLSGALHGTFNSLMNLLGSLNINYNSSVQVILFEALPLILIMVALFVVAVKFIKKNIKLNEVYMENKEYDTKHKYLMTYDEYMNSNDRRRRVDTYDKISIKEKITKEEN